MLRGHVTFGHPTLPLCAAGYFGSVIPLPPGDNRVPPPSVARRVAPAPADAVDAPPRRGRPTPDRAAACDRSTVPSVPPSLSPLYPGPIGLVTSGTARPGSCHFETALRRPCGERWPPDSWHGCVRA